MAKRPPVRKNAIFLLLKCLSPSVTGNLLQSRVLLTLIVLSHWSQKVSIIPWVVYSFNFAHSLWPYTLRIKFNTMYDLHALYVYTYTYTYIHVIYIHLVSNFLTQFLLRGGVSFCFVVRQFCRKFTLFCRGPIFVANLRTFECKIFRPQRVLV